MVQLVQPSFSGGEADPRLYARVDLQRYGSSLAVLRNFVVMPQGGVQNRAGTQFIAVTGDGLAFQRPVRLIPFRFSTDQAYAVELGEFYARFFANGAPVRVDDGDVEAWSNVTTYAKKAYAADGGTIYISRQAGNLNHQPSVSPAWWQPQDVLEIETPWAGFEAMQLRYTQSADVMTLVHGSHAPRQLRRLSATTFDLIEQPFREGPFGQLNSDDAVVVSSSGRTGVVTITSNADIFSAGMIGQLIYIEVKDLTQIKPWTPGERGLNVGLRRRSDGKTYTAVTIPSGGGAEFTETGTRAPTHDFGRAWDGGGDFRDNGSVQWWTGVEWEYRDSGYGIVQITAYTDSKTVTCEVKRVLPDQVVGGVGSPAGSWNTTGDGVTKTFAIAGATGNEYEYSVTIAGVPVPSNPPFSGGSGGSGGPGGNLP